MKKVLAIVGATGQQGSGVLNYVTQDPDLSKLWTVRAITRDVSSDKAKALATTAEVVQRDAADGKSFGKALTGVHTLFAMTTPVPGADDQVGAEFQVIKNIADAAVEQGIEHLIFSTLPSCSAISGGKYSKVTPFDAKAKGEEYIKTLPIKSTFYCPGSFMENFANQTILAPREDPERKGTWLLTRNMTPETAMPLIDTISDGGKWIGAVLLEPSKYEGKTVFAATRLYSMTEMAAALSKTTGKNVVYRQVSNEVFGKSLPDAVAAMFVDYFGYINDYSYYGPGTKEKVDVGAKQARGKLATLEDFFERHPYKLD